MSASATTIHDRLKIACVGEAMIELSLDSAGSDARVGFAGDVLNTAIYLRRALAPGHQVDFISVVGSDALSDRMLAFIESEGVSTESVGRHRDRLPGLYAISNDASGERSFSYWRENSAARLLFQMDGDVSFDVLEPYDVIYLSAITLAILPPDVRAGLIAWIAQFRKRGGRFAFDSNYRPRLWEDRETARAAVSAAWAVCDIGLPSIDDEMALFGDADENAALARLRGYGIGEAAVKRGARGPVALYGEGSPQSLFAPVEKVVDTTAAGDSFNGAFLAARLQGSSLEEAMVAGHECASRVIGFRGAILPRQGRSSI